MTDKKRRDEKIGSPRLFFFVLLFLVNGPDRAARHRGAPVAPVRVAGGGWGGQPKVVSEQEGRALIAI